MKHGSFLPHNCPPPFLGTEFKICLCNKFHRFSCGALVKRSQVHPNNLTLCDAALQPVTVAATSPWFCGVGLGRSTFQQQKWAQHRVAIVYGDVRASPVLRAGWRIDDTCAIGPLASCLQRALLRIFTPHTRARAVQCTRTLPCMRVRSPSFSAASTSPHIRPILCFSNPCHPIPEPGCIASVPIAPTISACIYAHQDQQQSPAQCIGWRKFESTTR